MKNYISLPVLERIMQYEAPVWVKCNGLESVGSIWLDYIGYSFVSTNCNPMKFYVHGNIAVIPLAVDKMKILGSSVLFADVGDEIIVNGHKTMVLGVHGFDLMLPIGKKNVFELSDGGWERVTY